MAPEHEVVSTGKESVPDTLRQWREAERTAAAAQKNKLTAEHAAEVAAEAVDAAKATAEAATVSVDAAIAVEVSAAGTAAAAERTARLKVTESEVSASEAGEAEQSEDLARDQYREAVQAAKLRNKDAG